MKVAIIGSGKIKASVIESLEKSTGEKIEILNIHSTGGVVGNYGIDENLHQKIIVECDNFQAKTGVCLPVDEVEKLIVNDNHKLLSESSTNIYIKTTITPLPKLKLSHRRSYKYHP